MQLYVFSLSVLALFATSHGVNLRATTRSNGNRRNLALFHREPPSISVGSSSVIPNVPVELHLNLEARRPVPESVYRTVNIECQSGASYAERVVLTNDETVLTTFSSPTDGDSCEVTLLAWYQLNTYEEEPIHRARMITSSSFQVRA